MWINDEGDFLEPGLGRSDPLEEEGEEVGPGGGVIGENCGGEFGDGVAELLRDGFDGLLLERGEEDKVEGGASGWGEEWREERVVMAREVVAKEDSGHGSGLRFGGGVEEVGQAKGGGILGESACRGKSCHGKSSEVQAVCLAQGNTLNSKDSLQSEFNAGFSSAVDKTSDVEDDIGGKNEVSQYSQVCRIDLLEEIIDDAKSNKVLVVLDFIFGC
ncbi:hypothetical protein LR48_Vigan10g215000 [Vigna angularis]|uniref:Uncharacterized protein n=1 Tax=Phaseolus angularis TaxID=3914 RepID=A0A0L9VMS1_PHAAN|nr:hypothetical protein LR48_Vigan10g215000 [Vigna angularis]